MPIANRHTFGSQTGVLIAQSPGEDRQLCRRMSRRKSRADLIPAALSATRSPSTSYCRPFTGPTPYCGHNGFGPLGNATEIDRQLQRSPLMRTGMTYAPTRIVTNETADSAPGVSEQIPRARTVALSGSRTAVGVPASAHSLARADEVHTPVFCG